MHVCRLPSLEGKKLLDLWECHCGKIWIVKKPRLGKLAWYAKD